MPALQATPYSLFPTPYSLLPTTMTTKPVTATPSTTAANVAVAPKTASSPVMQILCAIALTGFTGFMVNHWRQQLTNHARDLAIAEQQQAIAATETTEAVGTPVEVAVETATLTAAESATPEAVKITDPAQIEALRAQVYEQLDRGWTTVPTFSERLVYRVSVKAGGAIANYQPINPVAVNALGDTPLAIAASAPTSEPVADFIAIFTPTGSLQVNPWIGDATP